MDNNSLIGPALELVASVLSLSVPLYGTKHLRHERFSMNPKQPANKDAPKFLKTPAKPHGWTTISTTSGSNCLPSSCIRLLESLATIRRMVRA